MNNLDFFEGLSMPTLQTSQGSHALNRRRAKPTRDYQGASLAHAFQTGRSLYAFACTQAQGREKTFARKTLRPLRVFLSSLAQAMPNVPSIRPSPRFIAFSQGTLDESRRIFAPSA